MTPENASDTARDPVLWNDWHPVATTTALAGDAVLGVQLLDENVVLWRSGDRLNAMRDACVHRGTKLSLGKRVGDDCIECPYHGWRYAADGRCVHIPAMPNQAPPQRARVDTYRVCERYGLVWVCLGEPAREIAPFDEWDDARYRKLLGGPYEVRTSGPRIVENFLDVAHFGFVHENILGVRDHAEVEDYDVATGADGVEATNVRAYQPDPYGTGEGGVVSYTYRAYRPLTAYFFKQSQGPKFSILLVVTPHAPAHSTAWMLLAMDYNHDEPEANILGWQDEIFAQDQPILESQHPALLPLHPAAEVSMACDRTAVAYRRWLDAQGVEFGVLRGDHTRDRV